MANKAFPPQTVSRAKGGLLGTIVGYATGGGLAGTAAGAGGGVYVDWTWDKSLRDAMYSSMVRDCMNGK